MTCLVVALVKLLPESPFYHLMKNNEIKAKDSLKWYRGQTYEDNVEIEELKYLASHSGKVKCHIFSSHFIVKDFYDTLFPGYNKCLKKPIRCKLLLYMLLRVPDSTIKWH